jgi:CheY-like chemotaxis protein
MGEPPRDLVIDDDAGIRDLLDLALADAGYAVALAADGAAALAMVDAVAPDVILLDMRMPVLDGWAFAAAYRRRPGRHARIVVMTAARDAPGSAAQIAATGYLAKPFDRADLLTCVARYRPSHE